MRETAGIAAAPAARCRKYRRGSFIPIPPSLVCLFDHLLGAGGQCRGNVKTECLRGLEVEDQFELGCKLHRKFSRLFPLENTIDVRRGASVKSGEIHTVGRQAAARYVETVSIHGRQPMLRRERSDQFSMDDGYWIR